MEPTDFDYIDYADAAGVTRKLPVARGTSCANRPGPNSLNQDQIASMRENLPTAPVGKFWRRKNCSISDGPWVEDNENPPSFIPDYINQNPTNTIDTADRAGWENLGISQSNQSVQSADQ